CKPAHWRQKHVVGFLPASFWLRASSPSQKRSARATFSLHGLIWAITPGRPRLIKRDPGLDITVYVKSVMFSPLTCYNQTCAPSRSQVFYFVKRWSQVGIFVVLPL